MRRLFRFRSHERDKHHLAPLPHGDRVVPPGRRRSAAAWLVEALHADRAGRAGRADLLGEVDPPAARAAAAADALREDTMPLPDLRFVITPAQWWRAAGGIS